MNNKPKTAFGVSVLAVAGLHFLLSFVMAMVSGLNPQGSIFSVISNILLFPLAQLLGDKDLPAWLTLVLWVLLSLTWGVVIRLIWRALSRRKV